MNDQPLLLVTSILIITEMMWTERWRCKN